MLELIMIDVALCAALIMVAAALMVWRMRRRRIRRPVRPAGRLGGAAGFGGPAMAELHAAVVPGFSRGPVPRNTAAQAPPRPARPGRRAGEADGPVPRSPEADGPGPPSPEPRTHDTRRQAASGAAARSDRVISYYEEADRPIADYLAALGWAGDPEEYDPR